MNLSKLFVLSKKMPKTSCTVSGCSCDAFSSHKWVRERCKCFHEVSQHQGSPAIELSPARDHNHRISMSSIDNMSYEAKDPSLNPITRKGRRSMLVSVNEDSFDSMESIRSPSLVPRIPHALAMDRLQGYSSMSQTCEQLVEALSDEIEYDDGVDLSSTFRDGERHTEEKIFTTSTGVGLTDLSCLFKEGMRGYEDIVVEQVSRGVKGLQRMQSLASKIANAEKDFSLAMQGIVEEEMAAYKIEQKDAMKIPGMLWEGLVSLALEKAEEHQIRSKDMQEKVLSPLSAFKKWALSELECIEKIDYLVRQAHRSSLQTLLEKRRKALKALKPLLDKKKSGIKLFKRNARPSKNTVPYLIDYQTALDAHNALVHMVKGKDIPELLDKAQSVEEARLKFVLESIGSVQILKGTVDELEESMENGRLHSWERDLAEFVGFVNRAVQMDLCNVSNAAILPYELPLSIEQVENMAERRKSFSEWSSMTRVSSGSERKKSFEHIGDTHDTFKAFKMVKEVCIRLGATSTDGIFRISGDFKEMERLMDQLQRGHLDISPSDVHSAAGLLKKYLRLHFEPIVSKKGFEAVADLCTCLDTVSLDVLEKRKMQEQVVEVSMRFASEQKIQVLCELVPLLRSVCASDNVEKTQMNAENLGTVFGPLFVSISSETDAQKVVNISRYGSIIVKAYIESFNV